EHAARTPTIFDDDRLSELFAQFRRDDAGGHVHTAAGDEWHDDLQRLVGIILCSRGRSDDVERQNAEGKKTNPCPAKTHHLHAACMTLMSYRRSTNFDIFAFLLNKLKPALAMCDERRTRSGPLIDQWRPKGGLQPNGPDARSAR